LTQKFLGWGLSNSLDAESSLRVVRDAIKSHGRPEIMNSDQGSQFTCSQYIELLQYEKIRISMDGKGRAIDNIFIERFWLSIKYRHIYLNPAEDGIELFKVIMIWLDEYNNRKHQGTKQNPNVRYQNAA
jgi:putative transposase